MEITHVSNIPNTDSGNQNQCVQRFWSADMIQAVSVIETDTLPEPGPSLERLLFSFSFF